MQSLLLIVLFTVPHGDPPDPDLENRVLAHIIGVGSTSYAVVARVVATPGEADCDVRFEVTDVIFGNAPVGHLVVRPHCPSKLSREEHVRLWQGRRARLELGNRYVLTPISSSPGYGYAASLDDQLAMIDEQLGLDAQIELVREMHELARASRDARARYLAAALISSSKLKRSIAFRYCSLRGYSSRFDITPELYGTFVQRIWEERGPLVPEAVKRVESWSKADSEAPDTVRDRAIRDLPALAARAAQEKRRLREGASKAH